MTPIEEHGWEAVANIVPSEGRDYSVEFHPDGDKFQGKAVISFYTDIGEAFAKILAGKLNDGIRMELLKLAKDDRTKKALTAPTSMKFLDIDVVDARGTVPVPDAVPGRGPIMDIPVSVDEIKKTIEQKLKQSFGDKVELVEPPAPSSVFPDAKKPEPAIETADAPADPAPIAETEPAGGNPEEQTAEAAPAVPGFGETKKFNALDEHWTGVLKAYMPNPDVSTFKSWLARLLVVDVNYRLVSDGQKVLKLPESFGKDWLESIEAAFTPSHFVRFSNLFSPASFEKLADDLYRDVKRSNETKKMYNGTVRLEISGIGDSDLVGFRAVYLTKKQEEK